MLLLCGKPFSVSSPLHVIYRLVAIAGDAVGDFTYIHLSHLLSYTPLVNSVPATGSSFQPSEALLALAFVMLFSVTLFVAGLCPS